MHDPKLEVVQQFLDYLLKERGYSPNTAKSYSIDLNQFCDFLNGYYQEIVIDFQKVDKSAGKHFLGYLFDKGISSKSVARKLATLKAFFKYLLRIELINVNPVSSIKSPKIAKRLPTFLEQDIIAKLMEIPSSETLDGLRDRAILEMFYSTGIRLSELINLSINDVDVNNNIVKVLGKGNKERIVPFGDIVNKALARYFIEREKKIGKLDDDEPLFLSQKGKQMSPRTIQARLKRYFEEISMGSKFSPHLLRHTFATHLLDRGADIRAVKDLLGHASLSSTQVYTHLKVEKMKKVYHQAHPHAK